MNNEQKAIASLKAIVATIVSILAGLAEHLGIPAAYLGADFVGLVVSALSGVIAVFYAVKRIQAGGAA